MHEQPLNLDVSELVPNRLFTHPEHTQSELRTLRYMAQRLAHVLSSAYGRDNPNLVHTEAYQLFESDGRHHRILPIRPGLLLSQQPLEVVGFFGQRKLGAEGDELADRDRMLSDEMHTQPGLLSYSSLELTNGDYSNLVLFTDQQAIQQWRSSALHKDIVDRLSPDYYDSIRLYNGKIDGTVLDTFKLSVHRVKYYDYTDTAGIWSAVREL